MRYESELELARTVASEAGELALQYQRQTLISEAKADLSPVTIADKENEKLISRRIREVFPDDGLLGEEGVSEPALNGRRWIIDPIDGTRDFVRGLPLWSILIGLEVDGEVAVGVSHMPSRGESYFAVRGAGAYLNDTPIRVSNISEPENGVVCLNGFNNLHPHAFHSKLLEWLAAFWAVRSLGGCMDAVLLARGSVDAWIEPHAQPWDLAALQVILEEAGARFFNLDGGRSIYGGNCAACVPGLEPYVRSLLGLAEAAA